MGVIVKSGRNGDSTKDKHTVIKLKRHIPLGSVAAGIMQQGAKIVRLYKGREGMYKLRIDRKINESDLNKFISYRIKNGRI